jgi:enamine deaminase RidA (YjgF/YER057c/UK114 family)
MKLNFRALMLIGLFASSASSQSLLRRIESDPATGLSAAVVVEDCQLIHTSQILPLDEQGRLNGGTTEEQLEQVLKQLDDTITACNTARDRVIKLNVYVADAPTRTFVSTRLADWFGKDSLPAVSYVATVLPVSEAVVALDAVIASEENVDAKLPSFGTLKDDELKADWSVMPRGDVVYVSGQAEPGALAEATRATLDSLLRTLRHMNLDQQHIAAIKCFLQPMSQVGIVDPEIKKFFGDTTLPPVSHVEWISGSLPIEIELIAYAPSAGGDETVSFSALPWLSTSPVFSRVARIHGDRRVYVAGLYSTGDGSGEAQVRSSFRSLAEILTKAGSDMRHLAKATYYVSDDDASSQLNAIRPSIYDPQRPPAASKAVVKDVASERRSITIDMIAAPARPIP